MKEKHGDIWASVPILERFTRGRAKVVWTGKEGRHTEVQLTGTAEAAGRCCLIATRVQDQGQSLPAKNSDTELQILVLRSSRRKALTEDISQNCKVCVVHVCLCEVRCSQSHSPALLNTFWIK